MVELHHVYVVVFGITAVLSLVVALFAWQQRNDFNATALTALMLGVTLWCGAEAFLWWAPSLDQQKFWLAMTYPGVFVVVMALIVFAFEIAGMAEWRTPKRILLVAIAPATMAVVAMTNPGGLVYTSFVAQQMGPHTHYATQGGPLFLLYLAVTYALPLSAFYLIGRTYLRSSGTKRTQCRLVLAGAVLPFGVSVANQLRPQQLEGLEAMAFFLTGLIWLFALARGSLLESNERLAVQLEEVNLLANAMYDLAAHDPSRTSYDRDALNESLSREVSRSRRTGMPFALLALGINDFEQIVESLSPNAGEAALELVGETLLGGSRAVDMVCRYVDHEFLIVMPATDIDDALKRAEEMRTHVDELILHFDGHSVPITASIGVSAFPLHGETDAQAITAASNALAAARESGGGRTVAA